jgi:hypothetical protein
MQKMKNRTPFRITIPSIFLISVFLFSCRSEDSKSSDKETMVTHVFPSADTLSENLLRMYVMFSEPMKTVGNLEHIKLLDPAGNAIEGAIFNNVYELWSPDQKQLTLLFDPARVKSGLVANESMGRALVPGSTYELRIENLENTRHQKMKNPFIKRFYVNEADTLTPNTDRWELILPKSQTQEVLKIKFQGIIDQLSLRHRIAVVADHKEVIKGEITLIENEKEWHFKPNQPWQQGEYFIYVNARLEDPAGNNLNGLFDHKIGSLKYEKEGENIRIPIYIN